MLTTSQKKTAEAIVNIFETSEVLGDYSMVTLIHGDTGHLTYGRSQTTLGSGNLATLLEQYCANTGARFGEMLKPSLQRFADKDISLDTDTLIQNLLRACADDPVMRDTQDIFFDRWYWQPAAKAAQRYNITSPLGVAIVYDSFVHGSWQRIRKRTNEKIGEVQVAGEQRWLAEYVATRHNWLASHSRRDLRATAYRMDAFHRLIELDQWGLELPLVVRGQEISTATLSAIPPKCFEGPEPGERTVCLQSPLQKGLDVRLLQVGLSQAGIDIIADGIFGRGSVKCLKEYQNRHNMIQNGIADQNVLANLGVIR